MAESVKGPTMSDARDLFNREELSDVTVKYGSGQEMKCHKLILCSKSEYFKNLLKTTSGSIVSLENSVLDSDEQGADKAQNGSQSVIDLTNDHVPAVEAMLKYMYTFEYMAPAKGYHFYYHLFLSRVANKYSMRDLETKAFNMFQEQARAEMDMDRVIQMLDTFRNSLYASVDLRALRKEVLDKHFTKMTQDPQTRKMLEGHPKLLWECFDHLAHVARLMQKYLKKCVHCGRGELVDHKPDSPARCSHCSNVPFSYESCWVQRS